MLLTRDVILDRLHHVTVAPVTSTVRGIPTEVEVDGECERRVAEAVRLALDLD